MSRTKRNWKTRSLTALLAVLIVGVGVMPVGLRACDDATYVVAKQKWPLEFYPLLLAWQPGVGDPKAFESAVRQDWLTPQVNLYPLAFNMSEPVRLAQDRQLLADIGIAGYPLVVVVDQAGQTLARFQTLAEARLRLRPPSTQPEVVSYGMHRIELERPADRIAILFDPQAQALEQDEPAADAESPTNETFTPTSDRTEPAQPALVPSRRRAEQWAKSIAGQPLAGTSKTELIDLRNPGAGQALVAELKLRPLPVCVLGNPDGQVVEAFDRVPTPEEIAKMVLSPVRDRLVRTLAEPEVAFTILFVYGGSLEANVQSLAAVQQAARQAGELRKIRIPVIEADPADPREECLMRQVGYTSGQEQPIIVPVLGQGKAMNPMTGPIGSDDVLDAIQLAFWACGCSTVPRDIGRDLLLGAGGGPWKPFDSPMAIALHKSDPAAGMVVDELSREMALASFGVDPKMWLWVGLAAVGGLGLIGLLAFRVAASADRRRTQATAQQ